MHVLNKKGQITRGYSLPSENRKKKAQEPEAGENQAEEERREEEKERGKCEVQDRARVYVSILVGDDSKNNKKKISTQKAKCA